MIVRVAGSRIAMPEMLAWTIGWVVLGLTGWLSLGAIGALVAMIRDRPAREGLVLALVFGPLGLVIEAFRNDRPRPLNKSTGRFDTPTQLDVRLPRGGPV